MLPGFKEFEFELTDALMLQLVTCLDGLQAVPLDMSHVQQIPNGQGVYQLWVGSSLEYVGKTDSDAGLTTRLLRHATKIESRPNLRGMVSFKAVKVLVFSAMELETLLIRHYKSIGAPMSWQHSGFGSNDPGRERDTTKYKAHHFDLRFPIDTTEPFQVPVLLEAGTTVWSALNKLKSLLPYVFRFAKAKTELSVPLPSDINATSLENALTSLIPLLPTGWRAHQLPGYVILYKDRKKYPFGRLIAQS